MDESDALVPNYEPLKALVVLRTNLKDTARDLSAISTIPAAVAAIDEMLGEPYCDVTVVHKKLLRLERRKQAALYHVPLS